MFEERSFSVGLLTATLAQAQHAADENMEDQ